MKTTSFLTDERRIYYKTKQARERREREANRIIEDDAMYIRHYGMSAFLQLFPEAIHFGADYHERIVQELERMSRKELAQQLSGIAMAIAATKYKKSNRRFTKMLKDLRR